MELMKAYGSSAAPRSYEVWYTYVGGQKPLMNDAIKRLSVERGNISDEDIATIYDAHLATHRHIVEAEKTSASVIAEIDEVMDMIGLALGSTAKYGQSLAALSNDLADDGSARLLGLGRIALRAQMRVVEGVDLGLGERPALRGDALDGVVHERLRAAHIGIPDLVAARRRRRSVGLHQLERALRDQEGALDLGGRRNHVRRQPSRGLARRDAAPTRGATMKPNERKSR